MTITAKVILDSVSPDGIRLTTLALRFPKFLLPQFNTHRAFSRSASSSRAIPVTRLIEDIRLDPVMPSAWLSARPGMQPGPELDQGAIDVLEDQWFRLMDRALDAASIMEDHGAAKEIVNRIIEPWAHCNVVVTSTEWSNFFKLRLHGDAQNEMRILAQAMKTALDESTPTYLHHDEWHTPFLFDDEDMPMHLRKKVSAARCARVSYLTHEGKTPSIEADLALYDRLITSEPAHASPVEHIATPDVSTKGGWENRHLHGNFTGYQQWRKVLGL